jgi:rRNA processing protein Krr1/Pno1
MITNTYFTRKMEDDTFTVFQESTFLRVIAKSLSFEQATDILSELSIIIGKFNFHLASSNIEGKR